MNGVLFDGTPAGREPMKGEDAIFLSDLDKDPGETTNRRREQPTIVDDLATKAHQWLEEVKSR